MCEWAVMGHYFSDGYSSTQPAEPTLPVAQREGPALPGLLVDAQGRSRPTRRVTLPAKSHTSLCPLCSARQSLCCLQSAVLSR